MENAQTKFETWAVVELFGHTKLAGKVSEETISAQQFVRIDIPATSKCPAFTKYHHPTAVYGLTPVDEEYATKMAEKIQAQPINDYNHNQVISELVAQKMMQQNDTQKKLSKGTLFDLNQEE